MSCSHRLRSRACAFAALALVLGAARAAAARDFLWKVSGKGGSIYVAGSIHLLRQDFYPLSQAVERAFAESDLLVEELDLGELLSPGAQMQLLARGMLPGNTSLEAVVSPATLTLVADRAKQLGLPLEPLKRFKPWSLALTLSGLEWQRAGFDAEIGLDRHFYDRARAEQKGVQGLETVDYQISRLDGLAADEQERLLSETLADLDTELANLTALVGAWKSGDAAAVERIVLQDVQREPVLYQRLLVERNREWLPRLEALLARPRPAFVVVGAAHLVGPDGLLAMLKARGYAVEQL